MCLRFRKGIGSAVHRNFVVKNFPVNATDLRVGIVRFAVHGKYAAVFRLQVALAVEYVFVALFVKEYVARQLVLAKHFRRRVDDNLARVFVVGNIVAVAVVKERAFQARVEYVRNFRLAVIIKNGKFARFIFVSV